jgi:hypothetical protein
MDHQPSSPIPGSAPAASRRGAVGKALLVWLVSGSFGLAVVAFVAFKVMGC